MLRTILPIFLVVLGLAIPAQADVPLGGTARDKLAQYLLGQVTAIEKRLPALSVEDRARIEKETKEALAGGDIMRFRTLMEGPDQTLWSVRQHLDPMLGAISSLANRQYDNKQAEVEMWALVAKKMSEGALYFGLEKLGESKVVFPPILVEGAPPRQKFHEIRSNIHNNILLPYIQGQLPD
ncbi:MAG: hypothetical protein QF830_06265 [Rhodospirillales bacterium]|mgnify:FL=1|jgi:hypothetical protein|nr:hypothetical protein [Rhodospirillales bacterium]MDP6883718.1 hypothetical protein [Rhodospirillales bacterium]